MYLSNYYNDDSFTFICEKCNTTNPMDCSSKPILKKLSENTYILKDGESLTCEICGNIHTWEIPLLKQQDQQDENTPICPTCNSTNINKISTLNKVGSVAGFGLLSAGHISKTFKCDNCGYKW